MQRPQTYALHLVQPASKSNMFPLTKPYWRLIVAYSIQSFTVTQRCLTISMCRIQARLPFVKLNWLHLGVKYDIQRCTDNCIEFLMRTLDDNNVCTHLQLAILYRKKRWIEVCDKHVLLNTVMVFDSVGFSICDKNVLGHILKMDVLSCLEVEIFEACWRYISAIWVSECSIIDGVGAF